MRGPSVVALSFPESERRHEHQEHQDDDEAVELEVERQDHRQAELAHGHEPDDGHKPDHRVPPGERDGRRSRPLRAVGAGVPPEPDGRGVCRGLVLHRADPRVRSKAQASRSRGGAVRMRGAGSPTAAVCLGSRALAPAVQQQDQTEGEADDQDRDSSRRRERAVVDLRRARRRLELSHDHPLLIGDLRPDCLSPSQSWNALTVSCASLRASGPCRLYALTSMIGIGESLYEPRTASPSRTQPARRRYPRRRRRCSAGAWSPDRTG